MAQPLFVFDMDDTLVNGDCAMLWNAFLVEKGIVKDPIFLTKDREMMALYAKGEMEMQSYLCFALAPITALPASTVDTLVDEFIMSAVMPKVFPEALTLIKQLKADNMPLLIVSATVTFIVKKIAQQLGIDHAIGIDLKMKNGCYSEHISGVASYREGKVIRLKSWLKETQTRVDSVHFYTDSINDLPLCLYADHVYLINPCPQLRAQRKQHPQWQVFQWGKR